MKKGCALITGLLAAAFSAMPAHAAEETGRHAEKAAGLPQFDPSTFTSQIFWLGIAFLLSYFIFARRVLPAIGTVLQARGAQIEAQIRAAQDLRTQVEGMKTSYEAGLASSRAGATKLMDETVVTLKQKSEQTLRDFQKRTESETAALETRIVAEKDRAMAEITPIVAEIASEAASKIVGVTADIVQVRDVVDALNRRKKAA